MSIRKQFVPLMEFLEGNRGQKVSDLLPQITQICSAKSNRSGEKVALFIGEGEKRKPVAILCWAFKRWMPLVGDNAVEFGSKANTATGLNTMCKEGTSWWTKNNREKKEAEADILKQVKAETLKPNQIDAAEAAVTKKFSVRPESKLGFATKDEVIAYLGKNGIKANQLSE